MNPTKQRFILFCFFLVVIVAGVAVMVGRVLSGPPKVDPTAKSKNIEMADRGLTLKERIGVDDHASLAILYGADMEGSLDLCG